jgi:hypothetical protein
MPFFNGSFCQEKFGAGLVDSGQFRHSAPHLWQERALGSRPSDGVSAVILTGILAETVLSIQIIVIARGVKFGVKPAILR